MNYGSVTSGIEAATVAWKPLGWKAKWFSEIEPFPCRLLKYHYPDVPNLGDMTKLETNETFKKSTIDLLVGGTPCQSFSLAGLRGGITDVRGNLALEFCRLLIKKRPRWFVWENVPGVFSSFTDETQGENMEGTGPNNEREFTETADFATLLTAFRECGYCCAWRVLDSQHFGVPQRRRRVFVVGYFGNDWRPSFAVLFEREGLRRDFTPRKEKKQGVAGTINASASRSRGAGIDPGSISVYGGNNCSGSVPISPAINTKNMANRIDFETGAIVVATLDASFGRLQGASGQDLKHGHSHLIPLQLLPISIRTAQTSSNGWGINTDGQAYTLDAAGAGTGQAVLQPISFNPNATTSNRDTPSEIVKTIKTTTRSAVMMPTMVRRLTPLECERLQGFPDNYTAIPGAKDGPRYKALGNSMTTNVMRWIGQRIDIVDKIFSNAK